MCLGHWNRRQEQQPDVDLMIENHSFDLTRDEFECYVTSLTRVADSLGADCSILNQRNTVKPQTTLSVIEMNHEVPDEKITPTNSPVEQSEFCFGNALIRLRPGKVEQIVELRVAVVGNVDAGKSTLLGVLTKSVLDDGRGKARVNLFRHKHEIDSGRTSSVGSEILGFDSKGQVVTPETLGKPKITSEDICLVSSKILAFIDLAGHEKYLKTTVFGMTGCAPDFVMLMVC